MTTIIIGPTNERAQGIAEVFRQAGNDVILADAEQIEAVPDFHVALFNPGVRVVGEFMDTTPADWDRALHENFERMVFAAQAIAKKLIERGKGGRMIFLSSTATLMPFLQTSVTGTTLAALDAVAGMAAVDLGPHGITVNVVACGWIEADEARQYLHPEGRVFIEEGIPVGRIGSVEDIAAVCRFLASEEAAYITGATIPVDGGYILTRSDGPSPYPQPK